MTSLIACLSSGKGTWSQVIQLINSQEWEQVFLVTNRFGSETFKSDKCHLIVLDENASIADMSAAIGQALQDRVHDLEIALNLASGTGAEHMALISAVLKQGLAFRLVIPDETGAKEL